MSQADEVTQLPCICIVILLWFLVMAIRAGTLIQMLVMTGKALGRTTCQFWVRKTETRFRAATMA